MPKQIYRLSSFHGGLNTQNHQSEIQDIESPQLSNVSIEEVGKIKLMGSVTSTLETADTSGISGDMKAGYGLHAWRSDYKGGDDAGAGEATTGDEYIAFYDGTDGEVWMYGTETADWNDHRSNAGSGVIDLGSSNTSTAEPCFYSVDGGLRLSDGNHSSTNNPKWYQYIERRLFQNISDTVNIDQWYSTDQAISAPDDTTEFDQAITTNTLNAGQTYDSGDSDKDQYFEVSSDTIYDTASNVVNMKGFLEVTVRITTANYSSSLIPSVDDFAVTFDLTAGSALLPANVFVGTAGTHYKQLSTVENGNQTASATRDIVFTFDMGDNFYTQSASAGGQTFDNGDTTNGIAVKLENILFNSTYISALDIRRLRIQEASPTTNSPSELNTGNVHIQIAYNTPDTSDAVAIGWDKIWEYGVSFIYDGNQESLVRTMFDSSASDTTEMDNSNGPNKSPQVKMYLKHGTATNFNRRITGAVWYIREASGGASANEWTAQIEYDFVKGVSRILSTGKEVNCSYNAIDSQYEFEVDNDNLLSPNLVGTYLSRTGIQDSEKSIKASYKTAVVANRRTYIGNVKIENEDGTYEVKGDGMLKSLPNKFDSFPSSLLVEATVNDGESIVKLETFADRILQYKQDTLYIINISQGIEFLEDVHKYKGVSHPSMVCKTDYGIAWINELGCYFYDGKEVVNLLERGGQKVIDDATWQGHITDTSTASSMIGYIPKKRQLIIKKSNSNVSDASDVYLFDLVTRSWSRGVDVLTPDSQLTSNFIVFQNELIYMHTNQTNAMAKYVSTPTSNAGFEFFTKDINFNLPGVRKKIYAIYVHYNSDGDTNVQLKYRTNGSATDRDFAVKDNTFDEGGSALDDFVDAEDSTVELSSTSDVTKIASFKPSTASHANDINSIQLKINIDSGQTIPSTFELYGIEIVYRAKNVK